MPTVEQYLQYERECRELAAKLPKPEHKRTLEDMAATWARLAANRRMHIMNESRVRRQNPRR